MKEYFICDGKKYIIEDNNFYKVFNNELITPTKHELKKVKELIKNTNKDIFSSPKLNEIAKKNKELYRIDILPEILERMEKFIGEENIKLFYENLETVRFKFADPIESDDSITINETGYHDHMTNTIHIHANSIDHLRKFAKENNLDFNLIWKVSLAHELFHMASCNNLYFETGYIYRGLIENSFNKKYQSLTDVVKEGITLSFTEGITQLFACAIYVDKLGGDNINKFCNMYVEEARVICQLGPMIGHKEIKKAYFHNLGIGYINDKLLQIDKRKNLYEQLSTNMGRITSDKSSENIKKTSAVKIQSILLQYEKKYIEMLDDKNKIDDFVDIISDSFIGYWKDNDNIKLSEETKDLIVDNLNKFYSLKEKEKTYLK